MAKRANRVAMLARLGYEVKKDALSALSAPAKKNKYGAQRVGGHASQKEHDRSNQLKLWQRAGVISNLCEQVSYELIPAQYGSYVKLSASALRKPASTLPTLSIPTTKPGRP